MIEQVSQNRIVWLDWMKVMAILSIIWGHFFLLGMYIYMSLVSRPSVSFLVSFIRKILV